MYSYILYEVNMRQGSVKIPTTDTRPKRWWSKKKSLNNYLNCRFQSKIKSSCEAQHLITKAKFFEGLDVLYEIGWTFSFTKTWLNSVLLHSKKRNSQWKIQIRSAKLVEVWLEVKNSESAKYLRFFTKSLGVFRLRLYHRLNRKNFAFWV